jgi:hypothetical protein
MALGTRLESKSLEFLCLAFLTFFIAKVWRAVVIGGKKYENSKWKNVLVNGSSHMVLRSLANQQIYGS